MNASVWMAVMHVMGKLHVWRPYLIFIEKILAIMDDFYEEEFSWDAGLYQMEGMQNK